MSLSGNNFRSHTPLSITIPFAEDFSHLFLRFFFFEKYGGRLLEADVFDL